MKYNCGDTMYTKKRIGLIPENAKVELNKVKKNGRKTYVEIEDINGNIVENVSVKKLRKKRR